MQIVIDIDEEQIKKSLEESKSMHEDEGEKGFVNIMMLYTNGRLGFVDVSRKTDFYSCKYKILPKGHGRLIDADAFGKELRRYTEAPYQYALKVFNDAPTIIEADKETEEDKELIVNKDVYDTLTEEQKKFVDIGLSYFNNRKR